MSDQAFLFMVGSVLLNVALLALVFPITNWRKNNALLVEINNLRRDLHSWQPVKVKGRFNDLLKDGVQYLVMTDEGKFYIAEFKKKEGYFDCEYKNISNFNIVAFHELTDPRPKKQNFWKK